MVEKDWKSFVVINPIDVVFKDALRNAQGHPESYIDIQNRSPQNILFKVKTTDPSNYIVRPSQGIMTPESTA